MAKAEAIRRALTGEEVGQPSEAAHNYAFTLAAERISGTPLDGGFETWQMKSGHELEPDARMEHEIQTGLVVQRAGFVTTDDGLFGASADGLIGRDGGSDYKCFLAPEKLRAFLIDNDASGIMDQVQGCMWITGRKFSSGTSACTAPPLSLSAASSGGESSSAMTTTSRHWRKTCGASRPSLTSTRRGFGSEQHDPITPLPQPRRTAGRPQLPCQEMT